MRHFVNGLAIGLTVALSAGMAMAQGVSPAMGEARSRMVCGSATLVSSQYIGGGMMRVTCRQEDQKKEKSNQSSQNPLQAGLTAPAAIGIAVTVITLGILTGNKGNTATTTSQGGSAGLR